MLKSQPNRQIFEFSDFRLDTHERLLTGNGKPVALTPKVFDLLILLLQHSGRLLEKEWLISTLWPDTFVEEANLSVNISTLRKALESAGGEHLIETVPKRGYRFSGEVRELTPQHAEIVSEALEVPPTIERAKKAKRWWPIAILGAIVLVGLSFLLERAWFRPIEAPSDVMSLAVLPFRPIVSSTDGQDELLGLGMADGVIRKLTALQKTMVRATSSTEKYRGVRVDPAAAGRELRVDAVLDGTIQRLGKMIRVSVQLLRVSDGNAIWGERFDDYETNIFQVQDSISEKVATALNMQLTKADYRKMTRQATEDTIAYRLYLKGKYCAMEHTADTPLATCAAFLEQAVARDPNYALAYAGLANLYMRIGSNYLRPDAAAKAHMAAEKAISLDDNAPETHLALGDVLFRGDWDWLAAEREFARATALDKNSSDAHWNMALLLIALGYTERGLAEMQEAQSLDPSSASVRNDLGWAFYCQRRYEDAIRESREALTMSPRSYAVHRQLGKAYLQKGRYSEAQAEFETTMKLGLSRLGFADLGQLFAVTGKAVEAHQILGKLKQSDSQITFQADYLLAVLEAALGENDTAFASLEKAVKERLSLAIWMRVDPDMDPLRRDPRFDVLLRRVHLLD